MTKKFNPKVYQGKPRVFSSVAHGISRLWKWNGTEYVPPERGCVYYATRRRGGKRESGAFQTLPEARAWQGSEAESNSSVVSDGKTFREVVAEYKRRKYPTLAQGTRDQYDKLLRLYLWPLMDLDIAGLTSSAVDEWIDWLKSPNAGFLENPSRKDFKHELRLLNTILNYYCEYHDDVRFAHPIKRRHREDVVLDRRRQPSPKDLTESEFLKFRAKLVEGPRGKVLGMLATIQFYHALRINEAAGLYWEDIHLDLQDPMKSRLRVVRSVEWIRRKGYRATVKPGFKNSKSTNGIKEQPLTIETFKILYEARSSTGNTGLAFSDNDQPLEYRWIQHAYDTAFKKAGLPYRGTHVMRHGGTRKVYNDTRDMAVAAQLLGNTTQQSVQVYAKRHTDALNEYVRQRWIAAKAE